MDRIRLNASEWMDFRNGEKKCFFADERTGRLLFADSDGECGEE